MHLSRRQGIHGNDIAGMAWDEMVLESVVTSTVNLTVLNVYNNQRGGAIEIELYTGRSKRLLCCSKYQSINAMTI